MILVIVFEAIHTGCWSRLTKFNYLDIKSLVTASSAGGVGIAKAVQDSHYEEGAQWVADPSDPIAGAVKIEWGSNSTLGDTKTMAIVRSGDHELMRPGIVRKARSTESIKSAGFEPASRPLLDSHPD